MIRNANPCSTDGLFLFHSAKWMLIMLRGESLFSCSARQTCIYYAATYLLCLIRRLLFPMFMKWILIYYAPRGGCLPFVKRTLSYYHGLQKSLSITLCKADASFSRPAKRMIISYIRRSRCLFIILCRASDYFSYFPRQIFIMLHETDAYLLCSRRRALIFYDP